MCGGVVGGVGARPAQTLPRSFVVLQLQRYAGGGQKAGPPLLTAELWFPMSPPSFQGQDWDGGT